MGIKKYLKRVGRYIIRGVPNVNVEVKITPIIKGNVLRDKTVLITGGNKGIGYSIAKRCIEEGANVVITGRNQNDLEKVTNELGEKCKYVAFDISKVDEVDDFYKNVIKCFGDINCLINNAGVSLHEKNMLDVSVENFEKQMNINLKGSYFITKKIIENKKQNEDLNIIFISSERGFQCDDVPYGLTKSAINSLTRGLSRRFYTSNIRVNGIAPGVTASDMTGRSKEGNKFAENQVAQRYFLPEEIAEVAVFLLSDASKCISGEIIACDAGQYISSYY